MLIPKTHWQKLSFFITIACLIIGLSFLTTVPAQAGTELIGPEGGLVDTGHNSSLIVAFSVALPHFKYFILHGRSFLF